MQAEGNPLTVPMVVSALLAGKNVAIGHPLYHELMGYFQIVDRETEMVDSFPVVDWLSRPSRIALALRDQPSRSTLSFTR